MLKDSVTLFSVSSIKIQETIQSLLKSSENLEFASIKLITDEKPLNLPGKIEFIKIPKINNIMDYNKFCFYDIGDYIETSHGLLTQYDSWVINPDLWDDEWLRTDYLGGLWPIREGSFIANTGERVRNGNGGFSLRSRNLMRIPKKNNFYPMRQEQGYFNEDGAITCYWRKEFLESGIIYGTTEQSTNFSIETICEENQNIRTFGFHKHYPFWQIGIQ